MPDWTVAIIAFTACIMAGTIIAELTIPMINPDALRPSDFIKGWLKRGDTDA